MKISRLALVILHLAIVFNAYACLVPLAPEAFAMAGTCSDGDEQPGREFCDNFRTVGPPYHNSSPSDPSVHPVSMLDGLRAAGQSDVLPLHAAFNDYYWSRSSTTQADRLLSTTILRI